MARTRCEVRFTPAASEADWSDRGVEQAEFYISPNPGEDLKPLARIASGGELSRIMLALKTLASTDAPGKTLIFDEVDAGIGGAVADVVGPGCRSWRRVPGALHHASSSDRGAWLDAFPDHQKRPPRTYSYRGGAPDTREREEELARMIGGTEVSATMVAGAREMLATRGEGTRPNADPLKKTHDRSQKPEAKGEVKSKGERRNRGSHGTRIDADK